MHWSLTSASKIFIFLISYIKFRRQVISDNSNVLEDVDQSSSIGVNLHSKDNNIGAYHDDSSNLDQISPQNNTEQVEKLK